jgi:hypothetical protein
MNEDINEQQNQISDEDEEIIEIEDTNNDCIESQKIKKKKVKYNKYTIDYKLKVIDWCHDNEDNKSKTADHFGIERINVIRWMSTEKQLRSLVHNNSVKIRERNRLKKQRKPKFPELDKLVKEWFDAQRKAKLGVTSEGLMSKALELFPQTAHKNERFGASWGWLNRFLERNQMSSRTVTSVEQKIPPNSKEMSLFF